MRPPVGPAPLVQGLGGGGGGAWKGVALHTLCPRPSWPLWGGRGLPLTLGSVDGGGGGGGARGAATAPPPVGLSTGGFCAGPGAALDDEQFCALALAGAGGGGADPWAQGGVWRGEGGASPSD